MKTEAVKERLEAQLKELRLPTVRTSYEELGVQGAAMSPLVAGTRPAKSWQDALPPASSGLPLHLLIKLANPAVGHRSHRHTSRFALRSQPGC